eukprot:TRINITY_DN1890_c0_g6_i1.p1 TRINITY_DN1890_c0_g6~~TRINITY_DN1890_c0_g6_i1.p1  ORF type:complete len:351 (-),score=82.98 TRINITY_DN1890_c0_g6_i1:356-1408(-)
MCIRDRYRESAWYGHAVGCSHKLLLLGAIVFVKSGSATQTCLAFIVSYMYLVYQIKAIPYNDSTLNRMQLVSDITTTVAVFCGLGLQAHLCNDEDGTSRSLIAWFLICLSVTGLLVMVGQLLRFVRARDLDVQAAAHAIKAWQNLQLHAGLSAWRRVARGGPTDSEGESHGRSSDGERELSSTATFGINPLCEQFSTSVDDSDEDRTSSFPQEELEDDKGLYPSLAALENDLDDLESSYRVLNLSAVHEEDEDEDEDEFEVFRSPLHRHIPNDSEDETSPLHTPVVTPTSTKSTRSSEHVIPVSPESVMEAATAASTGPWRRKAGLEAIRNRIRGPRGDPKENPYADVQL